MDIKPRIEITPENLYGYIEGRVYKGVFVNAV